MSVSKLESNPSTHGKFLANLCIYLKITYLFNIGVIPMIRIESKLGPHQRIDSV
jgi:hypothetical protein